MAAPPLLSGWSLRQLGVLGAILLTPGNAARWPTSVGPSQFPTRAIDALRAVISESEPNDSPSQALLIGLADTASGTIGPSSDVDWYAVDVTAGTVLDIDVDAERIGSPIDPVIQLIAPDSVTVLAMNDNWDGVDSRIIYSVDASARYLVRIWSYSSTGGYTIRFGTMLLDEVEPNDTPEQAAVLGLGDSTTGTISPGTDVDYYAVDISDSLILRAAAEAPYVWFPIRMELYGTDGTSLLGSAGNGASPYAIVDQYLAAGRYYISIRQAYFGPPGGRLYHLVLSELAHGSGDPVSVVAHGIGIPRALAALHNGDLAILDAGQPRILRVTTGGEISVLSALNYGSINAIVVDGYGDVLAGGYDDANERAVLWRITPAGTRTVFMEDSTGWFDVLTIGPDGDLWTVSHGELRRYDPFGRLKSTRALPAPVVRLAFSPAGDLYGASGYQYIYRLEPTITPVVFDSTGDLESLAFDAEGYLYVAKGAPGQIRLYSPSFQLLENPLARSNLSEPLDLAFGRDGSGAMTARLFVTNGQLGYPAARGTLAEVNPAGLRAAGWPVGVALVRMTTLVTAGTVGSLYADTLGLEAGSGAAVWEVLDGDLPSGVTLNSARGILFGIPLESGVFQFRVRATAGQKLSYGEVSLWIRPSTFTARDAANALLGLDGALDSAQQVYMDAQGNKNGRYDIGDLRAWLIPTGAGGGAAGAAVAARPAERRDDP